jgi:TRAP-type C4-dicarboxylate transport system permease small subunit
VQKLTDRLNSRLGAFEQAIAAIMLGVVFLIIAIGVIARYIVNMSIPWVEELSRFLFIWIGYLSSCYAFAERRHMVLEVFFERMPEKLQHAISLGQSVILQFLFLLMIFPAIRTADRYVPSNYLRFPEGVVFLIVPLSFVLLSLHNAFIFVAQVAEFRQSSAQDSMREDL